MICRKFTKCCAGGEGTKTRHSTLSRVIRYDARTTGEEVGARVLTVEMAHLTRSADVPSRRRARHERDSTLIARLVFRNGFVFTEKYTAGDTNAVVSGPSNKNNNDMCSSDVYCVGGPRRRVDILSFINITIDFPSRIHRKASSVYPLEFLKANSGNARDHDANRSRP